MQTITDRASFSGSIAGEPAISTGALWAGRALSGVAILFLTFDSIGKLVRAQPVVEGTVSLGYSPDVIVPLGITLLASVLVYLVPRTALLGAVLLTGYLGGAVATHVRVANPLFTHVLFPTYIGALLWGGLMLRDPRVRMFIPWRRS